MLAEIQSCTDAQGYLRPEFGVVTGAVDSNCEVNI